MECKSGKAHWFFEGMNRAATISDLCYCGGELIHQFWHCPRCHKFFYHEYGDHYDNSFHDVWYEVSKDVFEEGVSQMLRCPKPDDKDCDCKNHPFSVNLQEAQNRKNRVIKLL